MEFEQVCGSCESSCGSWKMLKEMFFGFKASLLHIFGPLGRYLNMCDIRAGLSRARIRMD